MEKDLDELQLFVDSKIKELKIKYGYMKGYKRKTIPKAVKDKVWDTYIGKHNGTGQCYCCRTSIDSKSFDCGHVVAAALGGENVVENMRPVCSTCNKSMGTQNMEDFKLMYFRKKQKRCCCF